MGVCLDDRCETRAVNGPPRPWVCIVMSTALLIVAGCTRSSASSDHEALGSTLNWPLGRSGNPRIGLRIPRAYAVLDDAAKAMNKAVYGESSPNEPGQV